MATLGLSIVMFAVGLILKFAVTATISHVDIDAAGTSLIVIGIAGMVIGVVEMFLVNDRRA